MLMYPSADGWTREVMMTSATTTSNVNTTSRLAAGLIVAAAMTTVACGSQTPAQPIAGANGVPAAQQGQQPMLNAMGQPVAANAMPGNGQVMVNCGPGQQAMI